ncbi:MAG: MerR family transcriptional regulator [Bacteroidia bacterium]|nr:MerR family transcriptional regulator [Bacteroidia bacterium]
MPPIIDFDKEPEKLYYPIGEVADMFSVNTSLIRFWEKEFDILKPKKNKKGNRLFSPEDLSNLRIIFHLVKERGYTLDGAKKLLEQKRSALEKEVELRNSLLQLRSFLEELKNQL